MFLCNDFVKCLILQNFLLLFIKNVKNMATNQKATAWIVTFSAMGINLILGLLYSWSVIKAALVAEGWTNTEASLPYTVCVALLAFMTVAGGKLQDKFGPRIVALIGGILFGVGIFLSAFVHTPWMMVLTFGVIAGLGMGFAYSSATPAAIKWFEPRKKGLIAGIVVAGIGISSIYMAPLTTFLLKGNSVQGTFMILGVIALIALSIFGAIIHNPPADYIPKAKEGRPVVKQSADFSWKEMMGKKPFYLLWATYFLSATAGLMLIGHIVSIARVQAQDPALNAFWMVMIFAAFNTLGRVVGGFLSDKMGRTTGLLIVFLIQAVNMFVFALYTTFPMLVVGFSIAGLAYGALFSLFPAVTADFFGVKNLGVNYGIIFTSWGIAGIVGPILGGMVADLTGTYNWSYIVAGIMLLLGALLVKLIKTPQQA